MRTRVIEFKTQKDYSSWLARQGDRIEVINVATARKNWSLMAGFLTKAMTYTVTYREVRPEAGHAEDVEVVPPPLTEMKAPSTPRSRWKARRRSSR